MPRAHSVPLYQSIYQDLHRRILRGEYAVDEFLPGENRLCQTYHASRFPVRAALKQLDSENLVRNFPGRGWRVISPDTSSLSRLACPVAFVARAAEHSASVASAVQAKLRASGVDLRIFLWPSPELRSAWIDEFAADHLITRKCSGIVAFDDGPLPAQLVRAADVHRVPLIGVPLQAHAAYETIASDNMHAAAMMIDHLVERGHRSILYATSSCFMGIPSFALRKAGYEAAMARHGLQPRTVMTEANWWGGVAEERLLMARLEALRRQGGMPTCILCSVGTAAEQLLPVLERHRLRVPQDVSLCALGSAVATAGLAGAGFSGLTHVAEDWQAMGAVAVERLASICRDPRSPRRLTLVPTVLVAHDSVRRL